MASVRDLGTENWQLKVQIEELKLELQDKESQMTLSGKLGNELLQSNNELNHNLEVIQESHLREMEELRQQNYSLRMKIDQQKLAQTNLANEMEITREKFEQNMEQELARRENIHEKKVGELQADIDSLQSELERYCLVNEQLNGKILKQEEMLADAHKYSRQIQGMGALESQLEDMKEECTLMRLRKEELKIVVNDVNAEKEQLLFDKMNLERKIELMKETLEETSSQGKIWFDSLQSSRQQLSELELENSTLKAEVMNRTHKEKGNSLFGEVEDKRLELELQHTALSAKYKSLSTSHNVTKKQLIELKTRILPMLTMAGNQADSSKIKRLESALIRSKSEIQSLYVKIEELEKEKSGRIINSELERFHDVFTDFKDKKDYVIYLQDEIKRLNQTIENLKSKNSVAMMKLTGATDKRRQVESQLSLTEDEKEKLKLERVCLQIKMDELKIKLRQAQKKEVLPQAGLEKSESLQSSLWKDASLFTKPSEGKKNEMSNEETLWPTNETMGIKPLSTTVPDQTPIDKPPQILSTEKQKPVEMVTSSFKVANKCTGQEVQQPNSKLTDRINGEVELSLTPSANVGNKSALTEHNQSVKTVKPRRAIHVKRDDGKNECQQQ